MAGVAAAATDLKLSSQGPDRLVVSACTLLYCFALGAYSVALPLVAAAEGFSAAEIGVFVALSALAQILSRLRILSLMAMMSTRSIVGAACVLMALSCSVLAAGISVGTIVTAQVLQGASRAGFWSAGQTHVVRESPDPAQPLALMNLLGGIGLVSGPAVAGVVMHAISGTAALWLAGCLAVLAAGLTLGLTYEPPPGRSPASRGGGFGPTDRRQIRRGATGGAVAGAWRGLSGSFIPLLLDEAGHNSPTVGGLLAIANAATLVGGGVAGRLSLLVPPMPLMIGAVLATGLGTASLAVAATGALSSGLALTVSGLGAGTLETAGPAAAAGAVPTARRGAAIVHVGTYRAGAMFGVPIVAAAVAPLIGVAAVVAVAGLALASPAYMFRR